MAARSSAVYRWVGAAVLRASTDPGGLDVPDDLHMYDQDAAARGVAWLAAMSCRAEIRAALGEASPALIEAIHALVAEGSRDALRVRRAVVALASYLLRWQRRPTPFGLFAGVGTARMGATARVRWGGEHQVAARADAGWLGDVLARLHQCPELLERLPVVANDAGSVRGGRFVAPGPPPDGASRALAPIEVSVRHSRPVRAALEVAGRPVRFGELRKLLAAEFPAASTEQIGGMLAGLLAQNMLISSLWAPMTCLDALDHACTELQAAQAHDIPEVGDLVRELFAVHRDLLAARAASAAPGPSVTARMRTLSQAAQVPLAVDTILDCDVQIPEQVAREARDAVDVLFRLSPYPFGHPAWRDYHTRFQARYGTGALVPVLELVADSGLGVPAEYLGSAWVRAARPVTERDEKLLALIQQAIVGGGEINLTDRVIEDLVGGASAEVILPSRVEIAVEVRAASLEALNRGRFALMVTGTPRPGSSMAGRHAHLLSEQGRDLIGGTFAAHGPDVVAAQLSFAPRKRRNENIARTGQLLPHVIAVAEHRHGREHLIPLSDLAVSADARRFHLMRLSTGQRVEPRVGHALEAGVHTPPLARFLSEIVTSRCAVYRSFHFGTAANLPYLPRVRYRRTILAPARWLLSADDLPGRGASMAEWEKGLDAWRTRWQVPEHVALVDHDRRQPVDLGHGLHRLILRTRLQRAGRLELREAAAPEDLAWLGRAHEVLIPLVLDVPADGEPVPISQPCAVAVDAGHLPGRSTIVYAQIYGHPDRFGEILTEHLARLVDAFGDDPPRWWFRRHREMRRPEVDQYLALYLSLPDPAAYGTAAERVTGWAAGLRRDRLLSHLSLATYQSHPGRYGHGSAMDCARDVFAADSAAALAQITTTVRAGVHPQALAAASMVDLATSFATSARAGLDWLIHDLPQEHGRLDPALRDQALELADPARAWTALASVPGGGGVVTAWQRRAAALATYREHLARQRDPLTVLRSLLHLHHIRAVGVDPDGERVTGRLARACALRHLATRAEG